jgi:hypothetical protein
MLSPFSVGGGFGFIQRGNNEESAPLVYKRMELSGILIIILILLRADVNGKVAKEKSNNSNKKKK